MSSGEQMEELRVVRVQVREAVIAPPVVPAGLSIFLAERERRRKREVRQIDWGSYGRRNPRGDICVKIRNRICADALSGSVSLHFPSGSVPFVLN